MGFKTFVKRIFRGNYEFGKTLSNMIVDDMPPQKAKTIGTAIDVGVGALMTLICVPPMISWASATSSAVIAAATFPSLIPAALGTIATAAVIIGLNALAVPFIAGLFSSGMDRLGIQKPTAAVAKVKSTTQSATQTVTKPFKWAGNKLSSVFKKTHDGADKAPKAARRAAAPQAGQFQV